MLSALLKKHRQWRPGIPLWRFPSRGLRITGSGVLLLGVSILIGLAALNAQRNLLLVIFGVVMGAVLVSGLMGSLRGLEVSRWVPDSVMVGRPFSIRYHVRNTSAWRSAFGVRLVELVQPGSMTAWPEAMIVCLAPGETVTVTAAAVSKRRGRLRLSRLRVATSFPFGLITKFTTARIEQDLVVLPSVGRLNASQLWSKQGEYAGGSRARGGMGGAEEIYGVRDYRPGDNPRWIHWRQSAKTGQLVTREMEQPTPQRVTVVLDDRQIGRGKYFQQLREYAISLAATLVCVGLERGLQVGLICSARQPVAIPPTAGQGRHGPLIRELALLDREGRFGLEESLLSGRFHGDWRGQCLVVTAHPAHQMDTVRGYLERMIGPTTVLSLSDGPLDDLFEPSSPATCGGPPRTTAAARDRSTKGGRL